MTVIPEAFVRCMAEVHGPAGQDWIARLPALLADCERRWQITLGPPFPNLTYNYVAPAMHEGGTPVVLKAGYPGAELLTEIEALRLFAGRGTVRLLDADPGPAVLLLERVEPGTPLSQVAESDDEQATIIAARLMRRPRRSAPAEI